MILRLGLNTFEWRSMYLKHDALSPAEKLDNHAHTTIEIQDRAQNCFGQHDGNPIYLELIALASVEKLDVFDYAAIWIRD